MNTTDFECPVRPVGDPSSHQARVAREAHASVPKPTPPHDPIADEGSVAALPPKAQTGSAGLVVPALAILDA